MNEKYVPVEVEAAAQSHWQARDAYRVVEAARLDYLTTAMQVTAPGPAEIPGPLARRIREIQARAIAKVPVKVST